MKYDRLSIEEREALAADPMLVHLPDIIAVHPTREIPVLAWELKTERGSVTRDQLGWIFDLGAAGLDARLVRPADYDTALSLIVGHIDRWPVKS